MATRFARVDLSDISRDFRPIAVEPGVALLDKSHANATILFRWLGRFLAEPDWDEDSVNFFVRDEKGGRLEDVACQPATPESLKGPMKEELEALTERIEKIKPETPTERKIFRVLLDNFMAVTGNPDRTDSDSYFFRYKDVEGVWRLSWCWGYERIDQQPAPAVVCNHAECNLLFVKRPGWSQKCPCCEKTVTIGPSKKRMVLAAQRRRRLLTALLLLLLIFCLIWFFYPKKLIATPKEWSGTVGERIAFRIERKGLFTSTDVTDEVDVELQDSEILGFDEEDRVIVAKAPGTTYVNFRLGKLVSEDVDCTVEGTLIVSPKELDMVTGEITDLSIESPSSEPIRITSSDPAVVEITPANRLIARSEGKAEITVAQAQWTKTVQATVSTADIQSIAIDPAEVEVPVDGSAEVKVMGQTPERLVELAPDLLECQTLPSTEFATFDPAKMTFQGIAPTGETKQTLGMAFGDRQATASVEVVEVVPEQLEMTPAGPISLPLGQAAPLQVWATYEDGRRIGVLPHRVSWHTDPEAEIAAEAGLELRDGMVMAMNQPAGPLTVWAAYLGKETNRVEVTAVERGDVTLRLEVDRTIRLAGEPGQVFLAGSGPHGDVQLIPGIGQFKSSDESVLKIDEKTGAFLALTPGPVTLTATHLASDKEATLDLTVHDPANAKLIFQPELVRVGIDEIAEMQLLLSVIDGAETRTAPMDGPGVQYATAQPDAIRWQPPRVIGSQATAPFEVSAVYQPLVGKTAVGRIEVVDTEAPESIRVVPPTLSLAPGQSVSLRLQEKIPGDDTWHEVTTGAIHWEVPPELKWTPATGTLRPAVSVSPAASGEFALQASYRGKQAQCAVTAKSEGPDPNADGATLKLVRQPVGTYLPAGQQQRYTVLVDDGSTDDGTTDDGSKQEPAANVRWPADFENEFVRWQAPVLTAKQPGYIQQLRADAGNKTLLFRTITTEPLQYGNTPAAPSEQPIAVRIIGRDGQDAVFPVGADFNAFHIEAEYASGFKRRVTRKATMLIGGNPQAAPVAAANGRLRGIRPGNTDVHAEFQGVRSTEALNVNVTGELIVDEIRVTPSPMRMMPGETVSLQVTGYQDGKSVGLITGMPGVSLQAGGDGAVSVAGSELTAMRLGSGTVKAQIAGRPGVRSVAADVQVVDSIADVLEIDQPLIRMHQGESRRVGPDLTISRGQIDLSDQCGVTPARPEVVRYDPQTRSLVGVSPGVSPVSFTYGNQVTTATVEVLPRGAISGKLVIEPDTAKLAVGHMLDLRVYLVTESGERLDRTSSALLTSAEPGQVGVEGTRVHAISPGENVAITAKLQGIAEPATAFITVTNDPITALIVEPSRMDLPVGDTRRLQILGQSAVGTYELSASPALRITAGGAHPGCIGIIGTSVDGVSPGSAQVNVAFRNMTAKADVNVIDVPYSDLVIDPQRVTIHAGQPVHYRVTAMRGNNMVVLTPEQGLTLSTSEPAVAGVESGLVVRGLAPGRTVVVATLGDQRAEASLMVTPGGEVINPGVIVPGGPGGHTVYAPYFRDGVHYIYDSALGRYVIDERYPGGGVTTIPTAAPVALRFDREVLRMSPRSSGAEVRVLELLADGTYGRDVTADPNLVISDPGEVAELDRSSGVPIFRPRLLGRTEVTARLGDLASDGPLTIDVSKEVVGASGIIVTPDPLVLWKDEIRTFERVQIDPGGGQIPFDVNYRVDVPPANGIVGPDGSRNLRGLVPGSAQVTVSVVDPQGAYDGRSTTVLVYVTEPDRLWIELSKATLGVGETVEARAMAQAGDGTPYEVPVPLNSSDETVLARAGTSPNQFVARAFGGAQVWAEFRGREASADVSVAGDRFRSVQVRKDINAGDGDFDVTIDVASATTEGTMEYRVYIPGQPAPDTWVPGQIDGDSQTAALTSPRIPQGAFNTRYQLIIEARPQGGTAVQQYPFSFRIKGETVSEN